MSKLVDGTVAIVTGGAHGIGRSYCKGLADEGARVVVVDLDEDAAKSVSDEINSAGGESFAARADVTVEKDMRDAVSAAVDSWGRVDILVNNAAVFSVVPMSRGSFASIDPAEWDRMMEVNLKGTWLACRAAVPAMQSHQYGKIINVTSGVALKGSVGRIHYVTSKAGVIGFTRCLARELGTDGIRVNCVAPGSTLSEENPDPATIARRQAGASDRALGRMQTPEDLVGAVVFLSSPLSDFVTGQTLVVDGGSYML